MASRFVSQKLTSPMSRSRSLLCAHASAAASAGAPATATRATEGSIGTLISLSNGATLNLGMKVASSPVHGYEAGTGTLGNLFHGAAGHPRSLVTVGFMAMDTDGFRNYMSFLGLVWTFNFLCRFSPAPKQEDSTPAPKKSRPRTLLDALAS